MQSQLSSHPTCVVVHDAQNETNLLMRAAQRRGQQGETVAREPATPSTRITTPRWSDRFYRRPAWSALHD